MATIVRNDRKNVLFLLRAYNDLDHIAPIVWKMSSASTPTFYMFVDEEFREDYRVKYFLEIRCSGDSQRVTRSVLQQSEENTALADSYKVVRSRV